MSISSGFLIVLLLLVGGCNRSTIDEECLLSDQQMPAIHNLKLGTELDGLRNRFAAEIPKTDSYVQINLANSQAVITEDEKSPEDSVTPTVSLVFDENKHSDLTDVERIRLYAYQDRIYGIAVTYSNKPEWKNIDSFTSYITKTLNFPYKAKVISNDTETEADRRLITCSPSGEGSLSQNFDLTMYFRLFQRERFPVVSIWERDRILAFAKFLTSAESKKSSVGPTPAHSPSDFEKAVVVVENAEIRKSDWPSSEVVAKIPFGTNIEVIERKVPWFIVRYGDVTGWIHGDMIRLANPTLVRPSPSASPTPSSSRSTASSSGSIEDERTKRKYAECVRQREAFGVDTSPCAEWAKER